MSVGTCASPQGTLYVRLARSSGYGWSVERKASELSIAVGAAVRGRYKKIGMSQDVLSERTGITITTVQRLVAGKAEFDVDQLLAIAEALNTTVSDITAEAERDLLSAVPRTPISIYTKRNEELEPTTQEIEELDAAASRDPQSREDPIN